MAQSSFSPRIVKSGYSYSEADERRLREELAACYRLIAHFRMTDLIYTHISARLPGPENHYLLNPYGLMYDEVTASNLIKLDLAGNLVEPSEWGINEAGYTIHSAILGGRPDVVCALHTHTKAGFAVSCQKDGLLPLNQISLQFYGQVAYHNYEGIALDHDECPRLVADLGNKPTMILRNHGLLTVGRTVPEAFMLMYYLEKSCEVQISAQMTGAELIIPSPEVCAHTQAQYGMNEGSEWANQPWDALIRMIDRIDPGYRN
ncbi:MAG: class II aldolase/adducin family protein [Dongiaceae bacterium]